MEYVQVKVRIKYYGQARRLAGKSAEDVELNDGGTLLDAVKRVAVGPLNDLFLDAAGGVRSTIMLSVNGVHVRDASTTLADGDAIDVHTPLAGG